MLNAFNTFLPTLDDLSSASEEEFFDVQPSPGFCIPGRPQINPPGIQGPIVSGPLAGSNRGRLPVHSHSLPSINKVTPSTKMGNVQPGTLPAGGNLQEGLHPHATVSPSPEPPPLGIRMSASKTSLNTNSLRKKYAAPPVPSVSREPSFKESGSPRSTLNDSLMSVDSCSVAEMDGLPASRKPRRNPSFKKYKAPPPPSPSPKAEPTTHDNASVISNCAEPPRCKETTSPLLELEPSPDLVASLKSDAPFPQPTPKGDVPVGPGMTVTHSNGEELVACSSPPTDSLAQKGEPPLTNGFEEEGCSEVAKEGQKQRPEDSSPIAKSAEERTESSKKKKKKKSNERKPIKALAPNPIAKPVPATAIGNSNTAIKEEKSIGLESGPRSSGDKGPFDSKEKVKEMGTPPSSGAATPEPKSKVAYKRTMSGKLASLTNMFEAEDKSPIGEAGKATKSGPSTKVGKLGVLTSKFSGDKGPVSAPLVPTSDRKGIIGERIFPMGSVGDVANVFEKNVRKKSIGGIDITKFGSFVKPVDYLNAQKTKKEIDVEKSSDVDPSVKTEGSNKGSQIAVSIDPIAEEPLTQSPPDSKNTELPEIAEDLSKEPKDSPHLPASDQSKVFGPTLQVMGEGESQMDIKTIAPCSPPMSEGCPLIENVVKIGGGLQKPHVENSASLSMIPCQNEPGKNEDPLPPTKAFVSTKEGKESVSINGESELSPVNERIKVASINEGKDELSSNDSQSNLEPIEEGSRIVLLDAKKPLAAIDVESKVLSLDAEKVSISTDEGRKITPLDAGKGLVSIVPEKEPASIEEVSEIGKESPPHMIESSPSEITTEDELQFIDTAPQTGDLLASSLFQSSVLPDLPQETIHVQTTPVGSPDKEFFEDALEALTYSEASVNVGDLSDAHLGGVLQEVNISQSTLIPVASYISNHFHDSDPMQSHDSKISVGEPDSNHSPPSLQGSDDCPEKSIADTPISPVIGQAIDSEALVVKSKVELESYVSNVNARSNAKDVLMESLVQSGTGSTGGEENKELCFEGAHSISPLVANEANVIGLKTNEASCLTPFDGVKDVAVEESRPFTDSSLLALKLDGLDRNCKRNDVLGEESRLSSSSLPLKLDSHDPKTFASSPLDAPSTTPDMLNEVHKVNSAASTSHFSSSLHPSFNSSVMTSSSFDVCHATTMNSTSTVSSVANKPAPKTLAQLSESVLTLRGFAEKRLPSQPALTLSLPLWNNNREVARGTSIQRRCLSQMNSPTRHPATLGVTYFPQTRSLSDLACNQKVESPVIPSNPPQLSVRPKIRRRSYDKPLPEEVLNISEILRDVEERLSKAVGKPEPITRPDAYDPSSLDTLMPLPAPDDLGLGERRSRSSTPFRDRAERSPTPNPVFKQTEAMLTETDRILRKTRSHHSLRRSFTRSLSGVNIHRLTEVTADLNEEHTTAQLASERIEAEQSDRMRLEKEVAHLQAEIKRMTTTNDKLEMERLHLKHEVLQHADLNGEVEGEEALGGDTSLYKRKYEWCLHEIEVLKKQLKQQQEDDLDQIITLKKQLEKKVADAAEESDERRQVVAQVKKKSQRLQAEMNDLKILLEEQTSRNNLLEKKQRKFDQDMASLVEDQRTERSAKEKIQRERDQILTEKYSFEQEVATLKLELELKDEKLSSVNKELDELNFSGKVDEEVALLKKAKHDLELRVKDQEEELDDLAGQVQMLESAKVRLEMSIEQMRKENRKELSQRDEEVEEVRLSAQKKVKALEAQLEGEHEERTQLVRSKHELERRLVEAHSRGVSTVEEDAFHRLKKELRKTKALLKDTQTMLEKTQAEGSNKLLLRQLKTQLEDAEFAKMAALKAKQCADADLSEAQTQLEEAQRARKESEERLTRLTKEKSEMQTQLEESEEEAAEVMKKYKATVSQLSVDQISISEQAQLIADLEHDKQVLQDKLSELSSKVEVLEGETANIHTQRRLQMKIKELESKLDLESTTRQRLESQIARLKDQVERVSSDGDSLRLKESQAAEYAKKLSRQLREAKEDVTNLQARLTDALSRRQDVEKQYELAESEIVTLKGDLKLAFKRIEDLQQALQGDISDSDTEISDSGSENEASLGSFLTGTNNTPYRTTSPDSKGDLMGPSINDLMSVIKEDAEDEFKESFA